MHVSFLLTFLWFTNLVLCIFVKYGRETCCAFWSSVGSDLHKLTPFSCTFGSFNSPSASSLCVNSILGVLLYVSGDEELDKLVTDSDDAVVIIVLVENVIEVVKLWGFALPVISFRMLTTTSAEGTCREFDSSLSLEWVRSPSFCKMLPQT